MMPLWSFEHCLSIAREILGDRSDDELGLIIWEFTGYPGFFDGDRETQFRHQLATFLDAENDSEEAVTLLHRLGMGDPDLLEYLSSPVRRQHLLDWLRCQPEPITTRHVEHKIGIRRTTAARELVTLEDAGLVERCGTGEHDYPVGHHHRGRFSILWRATKAAP